MFFKISEIVTTIVIAVCKLKQLKVKYTKKRETSPCFFDKILSYDENVVYTHSECRELDLIVLLYVPLHQTQCIPHKIDSKTFSNCSIWNTNKQFGGHIKARDRSGIKTKSTKLISCFHKLNIRSRCSETLIRSGVEFSFRSKRF